MALNQDPDCEPVSLATLRELVLSYPGVTEGLSYGTPAFRVRANLLARLHDSGESLVLAIDIGEREALMESDPVTFYLTDHYLRYPWILVRLSTVGRGELRELFERAWRKAAPKTLIAAYDRESTPQ
ncbi:MAG: MmcQ/YjbR family DNA-binding protein [Bacteroidota bacterium]